MSIPSSRKLAYLDDNFGALDVALTAVGLAQIKEAMAGITVVANRY